MGCYKDRKIFLKNGSLDSCFESENVKLSTMC